MLVALQGKLEMEIAQLAPEDAELFMAEYGITELGLARVIRLSYDLLGLISFFTVGADEVRAWTLQRGLTAYDAAGEIHTDLQKGFIRAEVIPNDELLSLGGLDRSQSQGSPAPGRKRIYRTRWRDRAYPLQRLTGSAAAEVCI